VRPAAAHPAPAPAPGLAALLAPIEKTVPPVSGALNRVKKLTTPLTQSVQKLTTTVTQALQKLGIGGGSSAGAPATGSPDALKQLLSYLLR
jgi:hypothetical protein